LFKLTSELGISRLGFEAEHLTFATYRWLNDGLSRTQNAPQLLPLDNLVEPLRAVKDAAELEFIGKAVELADAAFEHIRTIIRPGLRESEVAWELERFLREGGSEPLPFALLVASGPNSALPHAKPTDRTIEAGEPVVIDFGAKIGGYSSDLSRTICLEKCNETFDRIYDLVSTAQLAAITGIESGISGGEADRLAREIIQQAGYGEAFGHGLGHGIGMAAHELPRLAPNSATLLTDNMVFTVEPGIYIPSWGGVRIEDVVVVEGKARRLSQAKR
jgi:Xaa-Pro aminopeptidase